ncbi:MAG TPA: tRNA uridine-5-carboxymethylaminomethyl(34) synthesis enzyme MnmG [Sedimentisphaerales bacterium]|nr:tRNA uridine-5-carboxymethylaminomethyl(34) synthesis enzyme MnmG [Sedimentisphaerales bacterium]
MNAPSNSYDCIVVGGGHAGIEAAHAAAVMGVRTALLTIDSSAIGRMSCNPAIGGIAKGQIAREVDALGGLMGLATDATGIQFRMLNMSKGPAVQSPRAQTDRHKYEQFMSERLADIPNLTIVEGIATEIIAESGKVRGIRCGDGTAMKASAVILTTGTFLRGVMHIGNKQLAAGRRGEPASNELSQSLERLGLRLGRLKTGTPARLDAKTIDYDRLEVQHGDAVPRQFSFMTDRIDRPQIPCWITYTNPAIHKLLLDNLSLAPLYSGQITAVGPRYCPSIENKVVRFADKDRHQIFLEPEDEAVTSIYCNGLSTSYPRNIQEEMMRLLPGAENSRILHYAYAIEYDYCPPMQLKVNLETKHVEGLFLAGQINGTSGYEEAAAQGIMAGINAALKLGGKEPFVLGRDQAYIGVLIDDLLTKGIDEPYRMFTSRAEYRLLLRADNADRRLTPLADRLGMVHHDRHRRLQEKLAGIETLTAYLKGRRSEGISLWQSLKQPGSGLAERLAGMPEIVSLNLPHEVIEAALIDAKYEGYMARQQRLVDNLHALENVRIPPQLDYSVIPHLRFEAKEKLLARRPWSLGQAARISGITPADITVIQIHLKKAFRSTPAGSDTTQQH